MFISSYPSYAGVHTLPNSHLEAPHSLAYISFIQDTATPHTTVWLPATIKKEHY